MKGNSKLKIIFFNQLQNIPLSHRNTSFINFCINNTRKINQKKNFRKLRFKLILTQVAGNSRENLNEIDI